MLTRILRDVGGTAGAHRRQPLRRWCCLHGVPAIGRSENAFPCHPCVAVAFSGRPSACAGLVTRAALQITAVRIAVVGPFARFRRLVALVFPRRCRCGEWHVRVFVDLELIVEDPTRDARRILGKAGGTGQCDAQRRAGEGESWHQATGAAAQLLCGRKGCDEGGGGAEHDSVARRRRNPQCNASCVALRRKLPVAVLQILTACKAIERALSPKAPAGAIPVYPPQTVTMPCFAPDASVVRRGFSGLRFGTDMGGYPITVE